MPRCGWFVYASLFVIGFAPLLPAKESPSSPGTSGIQTSSTNLARYTRILHDGTHWTRIPRGAVLHVPAKLRSKLDGPGSGKLVSWREFLQINRSWLDAEEVSLRQAEGTRPVDFRRLEQMAGDERMIVAVYRGGPIGVEACH